MTNINDMGALFPSHSTPADGPETAVSVRLDREKSRQVADLLAADYPLAIVASRFGLPEAECRKQTRAYVTWARQKRQDDIREGRPVTPRYDPATYKDPSVSSTSKRRGGPKPKLDEIKRQEAADMLAAGHTRKELAAKFGVSEMTLRLNVPETAVIEAKLRREEDIREGRPVLPQIDPSDLRRKCPNSLSDDEWRYAAHLRAAKYPPPHIAGYLGVHLNTYYDHVRPSDVEMARQEREEKIKANIAVIPAYKSANQLDLSKSAPLPQTMSVPVTKPPCDIIAVPLVAAANNRFLRRGLNLPGGLNAETLWRGYTENNTAFYAAYCSEIDKGRAALRVVGKIQEMTDASLLDQKLLHLLMPRFSIGGMKPDSLAGRTRDADDRDAVLQEKEQQKNPDRTMRETFLLVATRPDRGESPVVGELWIDAHPDKGRTHTFMFNTDSADTHVPPSKIFMLCADAKGGEKYQPLPVARSVQTIHLKNGPRMEKQKIASNLN